MAFEPLVSDFLGYSAELTELERGKLAELRAWLEAEVAPIADDYWERAEFPMHLQRPLADLGMLGLGFAETAAFENSAVFRGWSALEMGRVDAGIATWVGVQNGLALGAIGVCGSPEQRAEWLPRLASAEVIGAFGLTEPLSGSDSAQGLRTTARREGDEWVLNGSKRWIGNATFSDITVIWAKSVDDGQVKGFIVPTGSPGYVATKIERKQALRTVQNADIALTDVRVPESSPRAWACACRSRRCSTPVCSATSTRRWRRPSARRGCATSSPAAARSSAATASCSSTASPGTSPTPRRSTRTRAPVR
jgi:glutaryl-CoA dehydrogenase